MSDIVRTFLAVEIPGEVRSRAGKLIGQLQGAGAKVTWVREKDMHWTLKFLGDVDIRETPAICAAVRRAVEPLEPFDVEARGAGAFPDVQRPRTVWLGMGQGSEEMARLHAAVERELAVLGYPKDNRHFRPHLTIGRVRGPAGLEELGRLVQENADFASSLSTVYEVVIFSSQLSREGPTHEPLGHAELKGR